MSQPPRESLVPTRPTSASEVRSSRGSPGPDVFTALADPTRREILELVCVEPRTAGEIAARFPRISRPAVSRHLRVLRAARLCRVRRDGRCRYYALERERLAELDTWVERYREVWGEKLTRLQRYVAAGLESTPRAAA